MHPRNVSHRFRWSVRVALLALMVGLGALGTGCSAGPTSGEEEAGRSAEASSATYPMHTGIVATTFWIGEMFDVERADGSQVCSTYDSRWALHYTGVSDGVVPSTAQGCAGSPAGGCDGVSGPGGECRTGPRTAADGYLPPGFTPRENPFYLDLPFDDVNDPIAFAQRCQVIPWASRTGASPRCDDGSFSFMKNRWVRLIGPSGSICYGQVEDAGPSHDQLYHDADYVFGPTDRRPAQQQFNNAGLDVSPALNGCLGFDELNGQQDRVDWQFVEDAEVPPGPWRRIVTTSGVTS